MFSAIPIPRRLRSRLGLAVTGVLLVIILLSRHILYTAWTLVYLPLAWSNDESSFVISQAVDNFDITFADYNTSQTTAGAGYTDRVPAVMHHVVLGSRPPLPAWGETRQSCLDLHEGWETHYWTDETAAAFVADKFPDVKETWDSYPFLIQKVDALRYMILYEYGGAVLDMDLRCKRALGPLRRFGFVAIEAVPVGFSSGFMMAERHNPLVGAIVNSLKDYNRRWLGLPYPTVMFSTGCHFASTIHVLQQDRSDYKVLRGPDDNRDMHKLNGAVSTPIFDHLGSSAWHSFDGRFIIMLRSAIPWILPVVLLSAVCSVLIAKRRRLLLLRRLLPNIRRVGKSYSESSNGDDSDDEKAFRDMSSRSTSVGYASDDGSV
ncbi:hypothetical protein SEUCBS140593_008786 [Sporothrix eucalyptigena]|uniref:Glycosyl transferase n=1 Tax=Sporothrix eucalyptigena TaxID=1812306 RepID=A0ABP0CPE3_9PEZI